MLRKVLVLSLAAAAAMWVSSCGKSVKSKQGESRVCSDGKALCGKTVQECFDLANSIKHCGKCGRRCFNRQRCEQGNCRGVGLLSPAELREAIKEKDFKLINVRVPARGVIPGTDASVPHNRIDMLRKIIGDDLDARVVLYCGTSKRMSISLQLLKKAGYRNVSVLDNGIMGWMKAGFPVESGDT